MDIQDFFADKRFMLGRRVEFMPQTRTRFVENVSQSYGFQLDPEQIIFIVDDTVMGSGRDGCVVVVSGIGFKKMFQKPIYISFDKIQEIQVVGKAVVINRNSYAQEFTMVDATDLQTVFHAVQEWLDYRDSLQVDYDEYAQKMADVKHKFKTIVLPIVKDAMSDHLDDQEGVNQTVDDISECIDDIERLEQLIDEEALGAKDIAHIDGLLAMFAEFKAFAHDDQRRFNKRLLEIRHYDGSLGAFSKNMLKAVVTGLQHISERDRKLDRLNDYF